MKIYSHLFIYKSRNLLFHYLFKTWASKQERKHKTIFVLTMTEKLKKYKNRIEKYLIVCFCFKD